MRKDEVEFRREAYCLTTHLECAIEELQLLRSKVEDAGLYSLAQELTDLTSSHP